MTLSKESTFSRARLSYSFLMLPRTWWVQAIHWRSFIHAIFMSSVLGIFTQLCWKGASQVSQCRHAYCSSEGRHYEKPESPKCIHCHRMSTATCCHKMGKLVERGILLRGKFASGSRDSFLLRRRSLGVSNERGAREYDNRRRPGYDKAELRWARSVISKSRKLLLSLDAILSAI